MRSDSLPSSASASALPHSARVARVSASGRGSCAGRVKRRIWQRLRSVAGSVRQRSATNTRCVFGGGSSTVFSSALAPLSFSVSAGSTMATLAWP